MRASLGALLCLFVLATTSPAAQATSINAVVSQVYGGGGNAGAAYGKDFVELFNLSKTAVDLTGWKVQYSPATSTRWSSTALSGSIAPYRYYLVALGGGSSGGKALPAADATGSTNLNGSAGVVRILNGAGAQADLVGYGSGTTNVEGRAAPSSSDATKATARKRGGCVDTNANASDFEVVGALPRNRSAAYTRCDAPPALNAVGNQSVHAESTLTFTVSGFDPDGDALTYSASNLPSGAVFYADSRTFSWKPSASAVGTYAGVRFTASDGFSTDSRTMTIGVAPRSSSGPSTTTAHVAKTASTLEVRGSVSPDHRNFEIVVRLFRKVHGTYEFVAQQRPMLDQTSSYHVSFARAPAGTCSVRARFMGDDLHQGSVGVQELPC